MSIKNSNYSYCTCKGIPAITTGFEDDFGYWDVCTKCGKRLDGGHHYYNHYDGKDHEEFWAPDGGIEIDNSDDD